MWTSLKDEGLGRHDSLHTDQYKGTFGQHSTETLFKLSFKSSFSRWYFRLPEAEKKVRAQLCNAVSYFSDTINNLYMALYP